MPEYAYSPHSCPIDADGDVSCSVSSFRWRCWVQSPCGGLEGDVKYWTVVCKQHSHVFTWPRWKSAVWRVNLLALHATCRGSRGVWGWWMLWLTAQEREQHTIPSIPIRRRLPTPSTCEWKLRPVYVSQFSLYSSHSVVFCKYYCAAIGRNEEIKFLYSLIISNCFPPIWLHLSMEMIKHPENHPVEKIQISQRTGITISFQCIYFNFSRNNTLNMLNLSTAQCTS